MLLKDWLYKKRIPICEFAKTIGVSNATLYRSIKHRYPMLPKHAKSIELATGGRVKRSDLVWPEDAKE
tara:strand:- start:219 stop:422 length:204 start_codon:yes stop_codon:yes gene_type:complete